MPVLSNYYRQQTTTCTLPSKYILLLLNFSGFCKCADKLISFYANDNQRLCRCSQQSAYYTHHIEHDLLPECKKLYPDDDFIFMQDGATSHTSKVCQAKLRQKCPRRFIKGIEWPPKSPDCNVLNFYFWDAVAEKVYENQRVPFKDI